MATPCCTTASGLPTPSNAFSMRCAPKRLGWIQAARPLPKSQRCWRRCNGSRARAIWNCRGTASPGPCPGPWPPWPPQPPPLTLPPSIANGPKNCSPGCAAVNGRWCWRASNCIALASKTPCCRFWNGRTGPLPPASAPNPYLMSTIVSALGSTKGPPAPLRCAIWWKAAMAC